MGTSSIVTNDFVNQATEISSVIFQNSSGVMGKVLENLPSVLGGIGIILVGFLLGSLIEKTILKIFEKIKVKTIFQKIEFDKFLEKAGVKSSSVKVSADFLKGYIFLVFFLAGTNLMGLTQVSEFFNGVIEFLPKLVIALFIVLIGLNFADSVSSFIKNTMKLTNVKGGEVLGIVAKNIIIIFAILAALMQIEIAEKFVDILFIGVVATISIGLGLAIGLGGVDFVKNRLKDIEEGKINFEKKD
ncbi:hypothetical protein LR002_01875 [Candidatus Gracilibacteria bacterium]|nr:hypothetical protein [Candidatus Gracilibacteria bacterium]